MIVWCEVAFLQYLRLLRQTVRADTRTSILQQTMATGYICYNKKSYDGTRALGWVVITQIDVMCIYRTVLTVEQLFFPNFSSFFFQEKQEKQEKQETFPKFGNLTEGKIFGRLRRL